ncbi:MAG: radical SAM protein [Eubacteriales bacterium]
MKSVSLLIKPVSGSCNMRCSYCFYQNGAGHERGKMTRGTAEMLVKRVFEYADGPVSFAFQGGEPTLAGVGFYRDFYEAVRQSNTRGLPVEWSIQTNGLELDGEFAAFLAEKRFLVGLSLDGPAEIHDRHRRDAAGKGTFARAASTAELLKKSGADFNILAVVTTELCRKTEKVWNALVKRGFPCIQFILCLENSEGELHGCAPDADEYYSFLHTAFRLWTRAIRRGEYVSVRMFDNIVSAALGRPPELCSMTGRCTNQLVIEADGSAYPCDFYVDEKYRTGNICTDGISGLLNSEAAARFTAERPSALECLECRWRGVCGGGCRREFDLSGKTAYCGAVKRFLDESEGEIMEIAGMAASGSIRSRSL